jgi:putative ABC transport system permease protein
MLKTAIETSQNIARTMSVLAIVAVLLSVIGLFSLVSLEALRRMRELAIRRVVGANAGQIGWILHKNYLLVFALGLLLGCGGGWFLSKMLMDSIFKISYGVPVFALLASSFGMIALAVLTIGLKIWQTLRVNPAEVLRSE